VFRKRRGQGEHVTRVPRRLWQDELFEFGNPREFHCRHPDESKHVARRRPGHDRASLLVVLKKLVVALLVFGGCATVAAANTIGETYSVFVYSSPTNFAYATYTDPEGFINSDLWVPCPELAGYLFILDRHRVSCRSGVYFAPIEGGFSILIESALEGVGGGFFVPPDQNGTFVISPKQPSFLKISVAPPTVATPEPPTSACLILSIALLFIIALIGWRPAYAARNGRP
jgi:hypothetical protein